MLLMVAWMMPVRADHDESNQLVDAAVAAVEQSRQNEIEHPFGRMLLLHV